MPSEGGEFHWRLASSDVDARAIAPLILIDMHREVGRGRLNANKAFGAIYECVKADRAVMIFKGDRIVGSVGFVEMDFWYSDDPQLVEQWAYVAPPFRGAGSFRCIFEAAQFIAKRDGFQQVNMIVFNKDRARARSQLAQIGEHFSFRPAGAVIEIKVAEEAE